MYYTKANFNVRYSQLPQGPLEYPYNSLMPYSQLLWLAIIGRVWSFAGFKPHLHLHSNFIHNLFDELNYSLTNVCRSVCLSLYLDAAVLATISEHWQIDPCILNHHRMDNVNEHGEKFKPQAKISANMFSLLSHHNRNKFYLSLPFISMPSRLVSSSLVCIAMVQPTDRPTNKPLPLAMSVVEQGNLKPSPLSLQFNLGDGAYMSMGFRSPRQLTGKKRR